MWKALLLSSCFLLQLITFGEVAWGVGDYISSEDSFLYCEVTGSYSKLKTPEYTDG